MGRRSVLLDKSRRGRGRRSLLLGDRDANMKIAVAQTSVQARRTFTTPKRAQAPGVRTAEIPR